MRHNIVGKLQCTQTVLSAVALVLLVLLWEHAEARNQYCEFSDKTTLLIVDRTNFYDAIDREMLAEGLTKLYEDLNIGDRLIVHTITDDRTKSDKIFDSCYPGCPEEGIASWLFSTCRGGLARSDRIDFRSGLASKLRVVLLEHEKYPRSAIVETLASVTALYYSGGLSRVVVFSDLLENSLIFPWPMISRGSFKSMIATVKELNLVPQVSGVPVVVFGVGRLHDPARSPLGPKRRSKLERFWRELLVASDAGSVAIGERYQ